MSFILPDLGLQYGSDPHSPCTFTDSGRGQIDSPLRQAWKYAEPTYLGMLAASIRMLRDPYVVFALTMPEAYGRNPMTYFSNLHSVCVAAVFADTRTTNNLQQWMKNTHRRKLTTGEQPDWLKRYLDDEHPINLGDERLIGARIDAIASATARAHQAFGIMPDDDARYCLEIDNTLGWAASVNMEARGIDKLHENGANYAGIPLMDRATLAETGVPGILQALLNTELVPGVTVRSLAPKFLPLTWPEDRAALKLSFSLADQRWFDTWTAEYVEQVNNHRTGSLGKTLTDEDFFAAALRSAA